MSVSFDDFSLRPDTLAAIADLGYTEPTPVQAEAIPKLMKGYDLIGQSQTGTGKTCAFALPLIELIDPEDRSLQGVILCPTRELCMQVSDEIHKLLKYTEGVRVVPVYGGVPIDRQIMALRGGAQIIVGTPGRFLDHLRRHTIRLNLVQMVVLDEADEMLNMGFRDDMDLILSQMPNPRQTVLFSATMPEEVASLATQYMEDPVRIDLTPSDHMTVDSVTQVYHEMKHKAKPEALSRILYHEAPERALVFCNTKKEADELGHYLISREFKAGALHGDLNQQQRDLCMKSFRGGQINILIATDIAARGLDIGGVDLVVNYDLPEDNEAYVHRVGRTARAGRTGKAISFVVGKELSRLQEIMAFTGTDMQPAKLPSLQDLEAAQLSKLQDALRERLSKGVSPKFKKIAEEFLLQGLDATDALAAFFEETMYQTEKDIAGLADEEAMTKAPSYVSGKEQNGNTVKLFLNAGKAENIRVKDIVGAIAGETGVSGASLGEISILEHFSYIKVPAELAQEIITGMKGKKIKERKVRLEIAQEKEQDKK